MAILQIQTCSADAVRTSLVFAWQPAVGRATSLVLLSVLKQTRCLPWGWLMVRRKGSPLCDDSLSLLIWSKVQLFWGWKNRKSHRASYPPALRLSVAKVSPGGKEAIQAFLSTSSRWLSANWERAWNLSSVSQKHMMLVKNEWWIFMSGCRKHVMPSVGCHLRRKNKWDFTFIMWIYSLLSYIFRNKRTSSSSK